MQRFKQFRKTFPIKQDDIKLKWLNTIFQFFMNWVLHENYNKKIFLTGENGRNGRFNNNKHSV